MAGRCRCALGSARRLGGVYTHGHAESVLRSHRWRTVENSAAYLLPKLQAGISLLDVGCGPGTITVDLARRLSPGRVVGVDTAGRAVADAQDLAAVERSSATFQLADCYSLPFGGAEFDVVHAHQVLQHLSDPVAALCEMARVCRPGGFLAVRDGDYGAMRWWPLDPRLDRWLEIYEAVARSNGGNPDAGRRLKSWAHEAGLRRVTASASAWCFATPEDRQWWAETWAERISRTQLAERAVELGVSTAAELDDIAEAWLSWSGHEDAWWAVLHGELLCEV
jgi:ubiquinone/menaquinone biosynthesis C-methylase UbiE